MKKKLSISIVLFSITINSYAYNFKSPWDISPPEINTQINPANCKNIPTVSSTLIAKQSIYSDPHGSIRDNTKIAALHEQVTPIMQSAQIIANTANDYINTGNNHTAQCGITLLVQLAQENAIAGNVDGFQAHFTQAWILSSVSLSWLKLRTASNISPQDSEKITHWINNLSTQTMDFFNTWANGPDKITNMYYWSGLALLSSGIALNNRDYFNWGINSYKRGIDQINNAGFLPNELKRGSAARGYHIFALAPLVTMAELAAANNINLYKYDNYQINKLIQTTISSINNPEKINQSAGFEQQPMNGHTAPIGWLVPYLKRFPNNELKDTLTKYPNKNYFYLGGNPPPAVNLQLTKDNLK